MQKNNRAAFPKPPSAAAPSAEAAGYTANRTYKDNLFRLIFQDKKDLLSLYNALNGSDYQNPEDLVSYTIDDAIYI